MSAQRGSLAAALLTEWLFLDGLKKEGREFDFQSGSNGEPLIAGQPPVFCSISHGEAYVCAAVGTVPVGIDMETEGACSGEIAEEFFSEKELEAGEKGNLNFTELWTLKESCLKLHGKGMAAANQTAVLFLEGEIKVLNEPNLHFHRFYTPEGIGALCWETGGAFEEIREAGLVDLERFLQLI